MIRGIDVSAAQGAHIDWSWVAAQGIRFVISKAAEGNKSAPDPMFAPNVAGARAAGLYVGAYLFAYPLPPMASEPVRDPVAQAKHHFDLCGGLGSKDGEIPPSLDMEWPAVPDWAKWGCTAAQIRQWAIDYLAAAEGLWGVRPIVYTYPSWAAAVDLGAEPRFARYPLWMASYARPTGWPTEGDRPPVIAKPWTDWTLWQTAGGTAMKLSNGSPVDTDVFAGDEAELRALCYRPSPPLTVAPVVDLDVPTSPEDLPPAA